MVILDFICMSSTGNKRTLPDALDCLATGTDILLRLKLALSDNLTRRNTMHKLDYG